MGEGSLPGSAGAAHGFSKAGLDVGDGEGLAGPQLLVIKWGRGCRPGWIRAEPMPSSWPTRRIWRALAKTLTRRGRQCVQDIQAHRRTGSRLHQPQGNFAAASRIASTLHRPAHGVRGRACQTVELVSLVRFVRRLAVSRGRQVRHFSFWAFGTILAGCSGATTAAKLMLASLLEAVATRLPTYRLWNVVDDIWGHVAGTPQDGASPHSRSGQALGGRPPGTRSAALQGQVQSPHRWFGQAQACPFAAVGGTRDRRVRRQLRKAGAHTGKLTLTCSNAGCFGVPRFGLKERKKTDKERQRKKIKKIGKRKKKKEKKEKERKKRKRKKKNEQERKERKRKKKKERKKKRKNRERKKRVRKRERERERVRKRERE